MLTPSSVVLWNAQGQSLVLHSRDWEAALVLAEARGWKARGTRKPPVSFDAAPQSAWSGQYAQPLGQEVSAADAGEFAQKLGEASAGNEVFTKLAGFASRRGFLICAGASQERDRGFTTALTSLATALSGPGSRTVRTPKTVESLPAEADLGIVLYTTPSTRD